jgi:hypothetical protein
MGAAGSSSAGGEGHDMKRRTKVAAGAAVVLVIVLAAGGFAFWQLFGGSDPSPVALNPVTSSATPAATETAGESVDGTWTVDDTSGSLAEGTSSFAGYRVKEELAGTGANTAVGRTQKVSGSLTIDGTTITAMQVSVGHDHAPERREPPRRTAPHRWAADGPVPDGHLHPDEAHRGRLGAEGRPDVPSRRRGRPHAAWRHRSVEVSIQAQRNGDEMEAIGSVDVALTEYGIEAPTGFLVLSIAGTGTIELHLLFRPA